MFLLLKIYVEAFSTFEHQNLNCSKTSIYARLKFSVMYALFTSVSEQQQQSLAQTGGCEVPPWIKLVKRLLQQQCKWKPLKACIIMSNSAFDTRVLNLEFFRWKKKLPLCGYKEAQEAPICKKKKRLNRMDQHVVPLQRLIWEMLFLKVSKQVNLQWKQRCITKSSHEQLSMKKQITCLWENVEFDKKGKLKSSPEEFHVTFKW